MVPELSSSIKSVRRCPCAHSSAVAAAWFVAVGLSDLDCEFPPCLALTNGGEWVARESMPRAKSSYNTTCDCLTRARQGA